MQFPKTNNGNAKVGKKKRASYKITSKLGKREDLTLHTPTMDKY